MKRHEARSQAVCLLYEKTFHENETIDSVIQNALQGNNIIVDEYALRLIDCVIKNMTEIDTVLQEYSAKWKLARLPRIVLSILRAAYCEIKYLDDIPDSVAINEAVELAKVFAGEEDASFVNGVLGGISRGIVSDTLKTAE